MQARKHKCAVRIPLLSKEMHKVTPSDLVVVISIGTLHVPKYIPKVIGAYIRTIATVVV